MKIHAMHWSLLVLFISPGMAQAEITMEAFAGYRSTSAEIKTEDDHVTESINGSELGLGVGYRPGSRPIELGFGLSKYSLSRRFHPVL